MKTFFEKYEEEIERRKVSGETRILVGAEVCQTAPREISFGKTSLLNRMAKNWRRFGGEAEVLPQIGNFERAKLVRKPISLGEEYLVCDKKDEDVTIEQIQCTIKQKGKYIVPGFILSGVII